jgi:hypothetical protein
MRQPALLRRVTMKIKVVKVGSIKKTLNGCVFVVDELMINKK